MRPNLPPELPCLLERPPQALSPAFPPFRIAPAPPGEKQLTRGMLQGCRANTTACVGPAPEALAQMCFTTALSWFKWSVLAEGGRGLDCALVLFPGTAFQLALDENMSWIFFSVCFASCLPYGQDVKSRGCMGPKWNTSIRAQENLHIASFEHLKDHHLWE